MDVSDLLGWNCAGDALLHRPAERDLVDLHDQAPNRQVDIVGSHPVETPVRLADDPMNLSGSRCVKMARASGISKSSEKAEMRRRFEQEAGPVPIAVLRVCRTAGGSGRSPGSSVVRPGTSLRSNIIDQCHDRNSG